MIGFVGLFLALQLQQNYGVHLDIDIKISYPHEKTNDENP
jgi:hypothetical protein